MDKIYYESTRGNAKKVLSSEAILTGIAEDGGLFVPQRIPKIGCSIEDIVNLNYKELAYFIMQKFFTDFEEDELKECIENAYDSKFDTKDIAPLKKVGDTFFLELYHGPTIAFKDMALTILPYLLKTALKKQKIDKKIVILTATSGDTGKAALQGFKDVPGTKIIVFFPTDGVSEIQKMQMVTQEGKNTFVVGIKGNFDDAQNGVKAIFTDKKFGEILNKNGYMFSSANSINIGRLTPQVVYYFYAYINLCKSGEIKPGDKVNMVVPTGNFGNILAGYYAKSMGLPIDRLICASNDNKVLYDFIKTGVYDRMRKFYTTISPSMDILISSNLERLLYLIDNRNSQDISKFMELLSSQGKYEITSEMRKNISDFYGGFSTQEETLKSIGDVYKAYEYLMDTHTAVAYTVYKKYVEDTNDHKKSVIISTASPYKFTNAVMTAVDSKYKDMDDFELIGKMNKLTGISIPKAVDGIQKRPILHKTICEKDEMKNVIAKFLKFEN